MRSIPTTESIPPVEHVVIHGHRRAFVRMGPEPGTAPALLLLHGLGCDHRTWEPVLESLARRYTVIAPDLLGHGASGKPRADYSVGGYANGMRDLLTVLGIDRATVVGHSLGGGVAMQFAYQYPELTERLVLVAPGGLGPEVSPLIRAITTPGFHQVAGVMTLPGVRHLSTGALRMLQSLGSSHTRDLGEIATIIDSFQDPRTRYAIRHVVRAVVDWKGQIITMTDRAYLTEGLPMCVIWGREDRVVPVRHASIAASIAPSAQVEILPNSGHFPHKDHPHRFVRVLDDFIRGTPPAEFDPAAWSHHLRTGGDPTLRRAQAGEAPVAAVRHLPSA